MQITNTPWGRAETRRTVAPGIICVTTSSHGGYWLSPDRVAQFQRAFPEFKPFAGYPWLEEDCDAALAGLLWPDETGHELTRCAVAMIQSDWYRKEHPEFYHWLTTSMQGELCQAIARPQFTAPEKPANQQRLGLTFDGEFSF